VKAIVLLLILLLLAAGPAASQTEAVGVFADPEGTDCNLQDRVPAACTFYVVHLNAVNRTGVEFWPAPPGCSEMIPLNWSSEMPVATGAYHTGFSVAYGQPLSGNILVMQLHFFCQGLSSLCCAFSVIAHEATGQLVTADAAHELHPIIGQTSIINPTNSCGCNVVSNRESTWGKVKALYR
jgi:hypothetical protein